MATIDKDGIKFGEKFYPFAPYEECDDCPYISHVDLVDGEEVDYDICKLPPDVEDTILFSDVPEDKLPPCMR